MFVTMSDAQPARLDRTTDEIIGANVHMLIWRAGDTQTAVARALGLEKSALGLKLRGRRPWYGAEIAAVARHYGVDEGALFKRNPEVGRTGLEPVTDGL